LILFIIYCHKFHTSTKFCKFLLQNVCTLSLFYSFIFWTLFTTFNHKIFYTNLLKNSSFSSLNLFKWFSFLYSFCFILIIIWRNFRLYSFIHVFMIRFCGLILNGSLYDWNILFFDWITMACCSFFVWVLIQVRKSISYFFRNNMRIYLFMLF
jgi:hypothetical protein